MKKRVRDKMLDLDLTERKQRSTKTTKLSEFRIVKWPFDFDCSRSLLQTTNVSNLYVSFLQSYHISYFFVFQFSFAIQVKKARLRFIIFLIYTAHIFHSTFEKFQTSFMLYCRQSTDESDSVYLQNQIRLSAGTMGEDLAVFRIWNLSVLKQKKERN